MRNKTIVALIFVFIMVWIAVIQIPDDKLHITFCNVGQGDASLISYGNVQILIDAGPGRDVLTCLGKNMPFWDKRIEYVFISHQEKDHYMGMIDIFKSFYVDNFMVSSLDASSQEYQMLESLVRSSGAKVSIAGKGIVIGNSKMRLDIVHPSEEYLNKYSYKSNKSSDLGFMYRKTSKDLNEFSVVVLLTFGKVRVLFPGDIKQESSQYLLESGVIEHADILKIPHHGSKNGLTRDFLNSVDPNLAVISVGKNQWGHPDPSIISLLSEADVQILRTDMEGDISIFMDETLYWVK